MTKKKSLTIWDYVFGLLYPRYCFVCNAGLLPSEPGICLHCMSKLPKTNNHLYHENEVETMLSGRFPFARAAAFCIYSKEGILPPLIHQLKYHNEKQLGNLLGQLYGKDLLGSSFLNPVDFIVPVPLHPKKERKRGYNQAVVIAQGLSEVTGIPVSSNNLFRAIYNPSQTRLSKSQRWENTEGIFSIHDPSVYANKHLLLIDDIITTGSTIEACAHALLQCESVTISVTAIGRAF